MPHPQVEIAEIEKVARPLTSKELFQDVTGKEGWEQYEGFHTNYDD